MKKTKTRRLAAIMFTDIVGYTALMQQDENAAAEIRAHHRQEFQECHQVYNGEILQYFGDGTLSVFQSGVEAVECAVAIQQALKEGALVPLRIGLHLGDIVFDGTDIYGDGVNLASRIESMGVAGTVLLSAKLNDELKNHEQISTKSMGHFELKNITNPIEIFSVINEGITIPARHELKGKRKKPSRSIAVLPFINMSSKEDNEYFSDGMTEEIINALAKIKGLKVTSRTSSFFFKNKNVPIQEIGQALNVSTILEGSIRLSGNMMRITAQLINVVDDTHFWSETFDRSIENIFAVQDEISLLIADKLREHLGHFEIKDHLVDAPDIPIEVYKKYLKARYYWMRLNAPDVKKSISIFKEVIEAQPDFPLPYLSIHYGYTFLGAIGFMPSVEAFAKGKIYLDKAIELDENLPECQYSLAGISYWQDWDLDASYKHLHKALEGRPAYPEVFTTLAITVATEGKYEAGLNYIRQAIQLDPLSPMNFYIKGIILYFKEDYENAILSFQKSIDIEPHFILSKIILGSAFILLGRKKEALKYYQGLPDGVEDLSKLGCITFAYAALGEVEKAKEGITKLEAALQTDALERALYLLILCHTVLGNYDAALQLIEQGVTYRLPIMITLNQEPLLKPLHSIPRFRELIHQIMGKEHFKGFSKKKYKRSSLKKADAEIYFHRLQTYMKTEAPYLQPDLSLRQLAEMIDVHPNHLSQLLNEKIGQNFSEFINSFRIEHFKSKAADPSQQHLTILALAFESGFNSKTVFNTFFKKMEGKTPSKYWKSVVKD